jgi:hypothetical protein
MSMIKLPAILMGSLCLVSSCIQSHPPPRMLPPPGPATRGFYYEENFVGPPAPAYLRDRPDLRAHRPRPQGPSASDDIPVARRTANPNHVISPHEGHNVVDVSDFKSGDLARDPTNNKVFRVP